MKKNLIFLIMLSSFSLILNAEISLYDCLDAALQKSYDIKIGKKEIQKTKYQQQNSMAAFLPSIEVSKKVSKATNDYENTNNSLTASTSLDLFDKRFINFKTAKIDLKQAKLDYKNQKDETIVSVVNNYLTINLLKEKSRYYKNLISDYQKQKIFINELIKAGAKTLFDLYSIEIEIKNNEIELEKTENEIEKTIEQLNFLTGLSLKITDDFGDIDVNSIKLSQNKSFEKSYEIISSKLSLIRSKISRYDAFTNLLPTVYLQGSKYFSKEYDDYNWGVGNDLDNSWQISLNLQFDFGNFLSDYNNFRISKINLSQQKLRLEKTISLQKINLNSQKRAVILSQKQIVHDEEKIHFASQKFELAKTQYQSGLLDFFKLKDSANQLISAKITLINDKKSYILNVINYQKTIGEKILNKY